MVTLIDGCRKTTEFLTAHGLLFPDFYVTMLEVIKRTSAAGLMLTPTAADFAGEGAAAGGAEVPPWHPPLASAVSTSSPVELVKLAFSSRLNAELAALKQHKLGVPLQGNRTREFVTPEGVDLRLKVGTYGERFSAFALDVIFLLLGFVAFTLLAVFAASAADADFSGEFLLVVWLLGTFLLRNFYFMAFELGPRAATPGKRIVGLRVADQYPFRGVADLDLVDRQRLVHIHLHCPHLPGRRSLRQREPRPFDDVAPVASRTFSTVGCERRLSVSRHSSMTRR